MPQLVLLELVLELLPELLLTQDAKPGSQLSELTQDVSVMELFVSMLELAAHSLRLHAQDTPHANSHNPVSQIQLAPITRHKACVYLIQVNTEEPAYGHLDAESPLALQLSLVQSLMPYVKVQLLQDVTLLEPVQLVLKDQQLLVPHSQEITHILSM